MQQPSTKSKKREPPSPPNTIPRPSQPASSRPTNPAFVRQIRSSPYPSSSGVSTPSASTRPKQHPRSCLPGSSRRCSHRQIWRPWPGLWRDVPRAGGVRLVRLQGAAPAAAFMIPSPFSPLKTDLTCLGLQFGIQTWFTSVAGLDVGESSIIDFLECSTL